MKKPVIVIDFDGALLRSRPFSLAHERWFEYMSNMLKDPSIKAYAHQENWFNKVDEVMKRYLGDVSEEERTNFARYLYAMVTVAEVTIEDLVGEFAEYLKKIKKSYRLALITTAPEPSVEPILQKVGCEELFEYVVKSPINKRPSKKELLEEFIRRHEKPAFYVGNGDKDITTCRQLGIKTISVNWVSRGEIKGDYDIDNVEELEKIL